ncbi:MAG: threonine synthase, partial [Clostridia bacterium]|nr:threonine synthase [Clostridia bacterium]
MKYVSTRGVCAQGGRTCDIRGEFSACEAIIKGISDDGGLFVPSSFPHLDGKLIGELADMSYPERVATILSLYLDDFTYKELLVCANRAYSGFDGDVCPVVKVEDGLYMLELTHGPSSSVKDMWGALFAQLLCLAKQKIGCKDKTLVLIAANGDAGTLDGYRNTDGIDAFVFYPYKGISSVQRLQLVTENSDNMHVAGVKGNFDSVRNEICRILGDENIKSRLSGLGYSMTTANSANIGSILPLVASYISSYIDLLSDGEIGPSDKVNFVVPSEDFDCAIAGYYAYKMGLPVNKFIIAANANNKVVDLFNNGVFDINGDFYRTLSPSMDVT